MQDTPTTATTAPATSARPEILITREFDAPRETLFNAFTSADALSRWSAPHGCRLEIMQFDFREGGTFLHAVHTPDGYVCRCKGEYLEIEAPARVVYVIGFSDEDGNPMTSEQIGADSEWPSETTITVTFEELGGRTRLTLHQTAPADVGQRTGALPSWHQMFDRLEELVTA